MPVMTPGELRGCILLAFYVNALVIAENHICLPCLHVASKYM